MEITLNLIVPDGLFNRTIWEVVVGNFLKKVRHLIDSKPDLASDWMNSLSPLITGKLQPIRAKNHIT